jgi:hypothetical protein
LLKQCTIEVHFVGKAKYGDLGRCETCQSEGIICLELLFLPSAHARCPTCKGARHHAKTLEIKIRERSIADVLAMTVDGAFEFFADDEPLRRSLVVLREVGWDTSASGSLPANCPEGRRSGEARSSCSTNRRRASTAGVQDDLMPLFDQ